MTVQWMMHIPWRVDELTEGRGSLAMDIPISHARLIAHKISAD